ncbi:MAG: hypothetical protein NTY99_01885 [DPANN group archaeon]|nr:hypothetical protein [DPANN group archaeon]
MADDLEGLAKDYEICRDKLLEALKERLDFLVKLTKEYGVRSVPLFTILMTDGGAENYLVTNRGIFEEDNDRVAELEENTKGLAHTALDFFQSSDLMHYLQNAESMIKQNSFYFCNPQKLVDFSGFFSDLYEANVNLMASKPTEIDRRSEKEWLDLEKSRFCTLK